MKARRMILAGASGFVGGLLTSYFEEQGWECVVLTWHSPQSARELQWDGVHRGNWEGCLEGADVLVNLCGKSVNCRYHSRNRRELMQSLLVPTRLLGEAVTETGAVTPPPAKPKGRRTHRPPQGAEIRLRATSYAVTCSAPPHNARAAPPNSRG